MLTINTIKEIEEMICRAVWVDRRLPKESPRLQQGFCNRWIVSPDWERSVEDILADLPLRERPTREDIAVWEEVMFVWLPTLDVRLRDIVLARCSGLRWKEVSFRLRLSVRRVQDLFRKGLESVLINILKNKEK